VQHGNGFGSGTSITIVVAVGVRLRSQVGVGHQRAPERRSAIDAVPVMGCTETAKHYSRASVGPRQALPNHVERIPATQRIHCL
jgi:hypothetical protein